MKQSTYGALALVLAMTAACGSRGGANEPEQDVEGKCKTDPAIAATRAATPGESPNCLDAAVYQGLSDTCNAEHDPVACYFASSCVLVQYASLADDDPERGLHETAIMEGYGFACANQIAEGCVNRASFAEELLKAHPDRPDAATLQAAVCDGYRTACELGIEWDGCGRCIAGGCTGLTDQPAGS